MVLLNAYDFFFKCDVMNHEIGVNFSWRLNDWAEIWNRFLDRTVLLEAYFFSKYDVINMWLVWISH